MALESRQRPDPTLIHGGGPIVLDRRFLLARTSSGLPTSRVQLPGFCLGNKPVGDGIFLVPGGHAEFASEETMRDVNATYGLEMKSLKTGEAIARCGFDIDRSGSRIVIEHSPQGARRADISHDARRELVISDFRVRMVLAIVDIARSIGMEEVVGVSADNHLGVAYRRLDADRARVIMDDVYKAAGFSEDPTDKNYHFRIEAG